MSDEKKYYWLKLKKDFFKRHDVLIIESMPNGKDYLLFYLKLLVESVDHEGELRFSETIPYDQNMLATITNTNIDIVRSAMKIFIELKMMEVLEDKTIYLNEINKMLGSETSWAVQKRRQRNQISGQCPLDVLPVSGDCPKVSEIRPPELEIELEIERIPPTPLSGEDVIDKNILIQAAERILAKHPKVVKPTESAVDVINAVKREYDKGKTMKEAIAYIEARTELYASIVTQWPHKDHRYIAGSNNWYASGSYMEKEKIWKDKIDPENRKYNPKIVKPVDPNEGSSDIEMT
ncbi:MAG: phage replisome organizer N-terminal domain-containing protein [Lentisphaerota bacterium]